MLRHPKLLATTASRADFDPRKRVEYQAGGGGTSGVVSSGTRYVYDGMHVVQERNGSNTPPVSHTRGTNLSGTLEGAGGIGGLLARSHGYSAGNWSTHNVYHADGNGNITYVLNSSQTKVAEYRLIRSALLIN